MQTYEIVTGQRKVVRVQADEVEENPGGNTVKFRLNGQPAGSFVGFTDWYPVPTES